MDETGTGQPAGATSPLLTLFAGLVIVLMLAIVAPIITNFWFTIIGGSGIALEQAAQAIPGDAEITDATQKLTAKLQQANAEIPGLTKSSW